MDKSAERNVEQLKALARNRQEWQRGITDLSIATEDKKKKNVLIFYISNQPAATVAHNSILYNFDSKIRIYFTKFLKMISSD